MVLRMRHPFPSRSAFKRASSVMAEVNREAQVMNARRLAAFRPPLERFNVGDAVAVHYSLDHGEKTPGPTRGVVIGQRRKGLDSSFTILNVRGRAGSGAR